MDAHAAIEAAIVAIRAHERYETVKAAQPAVGK